MDVLLRGLTAALALAGCAGSPPRSISPPAPSRVANLHAFARLYGVVRWFHPSDAASAIDWDRFAIDGARRVVDAPDAASLRRTLEEIFAPIAPTMRIAAVGEAFPDVPALHPASTVGLEVVAWQHRGFGDSIVPAGGYASKRLHRDHAVAVAGDLSVAVTQTIDATAYRGQRIRLRGKVRTADHGKGRLWLRVVRPDGSGFAENMSRRPVRSSAWTLGEIEGVVDADATQIRFGAAMSGVGTTWFDDFELAAQSANGEWHALAIRDSGFEASDLWASWHAGASSTPGPGEVASGWTATLDHQAPSSGAASLRLAPAMEALPDELFRETPRPGETVDIDLGSGLIARAPIALYSKDGQTLGDSPARARSSQATPGSETAPTTKLDPIAGAADVIVQWNVFQHFWPYWDAVQVPWLVQLDVSLTAALADRTIDDHVVTLKRLNAAAPDGHSSIACPGEATRSFAPFAADWIEDHAVITTSSTPLLLPGDVILAIDDQPIAQRLAAEEAVVSGSPQWRRTIAASHLDRDSVSTPAALRIQRGERVLQVRVPRIEREVEDENPHATVERLPDGVYYVDLDRAERSDLTAVMDRLADAPGVVFDLRIGPNDHEWLSHVLTRPDTANAWLAIPRILRPDHPAPVSWDTSGWSLPVAAPHLRGRIAFLSGPRARSYPESVLGLVEHYHLGPIVGGPSAGANGDIAVLSEPTGCTMQFTGRKVTKLDGSRQYLVGFSPTIPAARTIAGVAAGRDEVLDRALAYVRTGR